MKILIASPFENDATGRGDRNVRLEQELTARGHSVSFVTGNFDHGRKAHISNDLLPSKPNRKVLHLPAYKSNIGLARIFCHLTLALKLWVWGMSTKWDVVVISSVPPEALLAATLLRKRALVVDIRDIWPDALSAYGRTSRLFRLFEAYCNLLYRFSMKRADRIMIVAPGFRSWLARFRALRPGKIKFVPLGFRREDFRPISDGGTNYDFCYAGGITPQFDIREFSQRFSDSNGIVLGSGPLKKQWKDTFPNTKFGGVVPRSEAMQIMAQSSQLLFPSNPFAQLPNKAFDYFALGHPVVTGERCTRSTRSLLNLRRRRPEVTGTDWTKYQILEKEAIATRAANIVESAIK